MFKTLILAALLAASTLAGAAPAALVTGLPDFTDLIDKVGPAVVSIRTTEKRKPRARSPSRDELVDLYRRYHGLPPQRRRAPPAEDEVQSGVGSGFIISSSGYVLTNAHVVEGADEVLVTLTDRRELKAKVLGADQRTDIALLKVEANDLPQLAVGDSSTIRVGEWVIAIGSPFNLESTVTAGIISAKARDTGDYLPFIQSDVAVNPGNSGGPLINMRGEAIGINSQFASVSGGYAGISFAVPIAEAMRVADQIRLSGKVTRGRIGLEINDVDTALASSLGLERARGAEVVRITAGGPADKGGIRVGDVILQFNGRPIDKAGDLPYQVGASAIGSAAVVSIWRNGARQDVSVQVALDEDKVNKPARKKAPVK